MTQLNLIFNSMPRDLAEFAFFLVVGFTAGSMGLIWIFHYKLLNFSPTKDLPNWIDNKSLSHIEIIDWTGKSNLDLPPSSLISTTVIKPEISLPVLFINLATQSTVPPVAKRSSTMA